MKYDYELIRVALQYFDAGKIEQADKLMSIATIKSDSDDSFPNPGDNSLKAYGLNGYTDSNDPRSPSARSHSGRPVTSVHTTVHQLGKGYRIESVEAYGPGTQQGGGRHVAYVEVPRGFRGEVILGTGYSGKFDKFDDEISHVPGQEIVINGKFTPPNLGPLAIFLKENGQIVSDVVGNLGLPYGEHVSYRIVFRTNS